MKKIFYLAALATAATVCLHAQGQTEKKGPDLTGEMLEEPPVAKAPATTDGAAAAQWYVTMDYDGFEFQLPAGLIVDKGSSFTARTSDGSFGMNMTAEQGVTYDQKIAFNLARALAQEVKLKDAKAEKVKYGKCSGARVSGLLDGQQANILVLPYDNQSVTVVMLNSPEHQEWADTFLRTLKR